MQEKNELLRRYEETRSLTMELVNGLSEEDWRIQTIPEVSPHWWCLGHTSWFFARNILVESGNGSALDEKYDYVLNSYYESLGPRIAQKDRGKLSKPTNDDIREYRNSVDKRLREFIASASKSEREKYFSIIEIGIHHEMQHQELLVTELKHIQWQSPKKLRRKISNVKNSSQKVKGSWTLVKEGLFEFGSGNDQWSWDIERPIHKHYLHSFEMFSRSVTNGEFIEFINDGGYENVLNWSYNGWELCKKEKWKAPLYWYKEGSTWWHWTLQGDREIDFDEPVAHISYYEAQAFARWASEHKKEYVGSRLPTEYEWEQYAKANPKSIGTSLNEQKVLHPSSADSGKMLGGVWEWTSSEYAPYPGFETYDGPLMEYNEKFMDKQKVLRGGSCATPSGEIRISNRNFWVQETRFQFSGLRLARDAKLRQ